MPPTPRMVETWSDEERAKYNREAFQLHFGRGPGCVVELGAPDDPAHPKPTGKLRRTSKYYKAFHSYPVLGLSSEGRCGCDTPELVILADLAGTATALTESKAALDLANLSLLRKRIKDPGVIKFAQPAALHVAGFTEQQGMECPGWHNLEWLGLRGARLQEMVVGLFGEDFECFAEESLVELGSEGKLSPEGLYAAAQRAQLAVDVGAYQLLLLKRTLDPVVWGWTLTTPRPDRVTDLANGRQKINSTICSIERPDTRWGIVEDSPYQSDAWFGRQDEVAGTMKRFEEKCAATKKVLLQDGEVGSGACVRALYAYALEMLALECVSAVESGFFPPRTVDKFETESRKDNSKLVRYTLTIPPDAWGGDVIQPSKTEATVIVDAPVRKETMERGKDQAKREAILQWSRKFTEKLEPVLRDLRVVSSASLRSRLRPLSRREQDKADKARKYQKDLALLWNIEKAFWFELRGVEGLSELKSKTRTALNAADNRLLGALYTRVDLLPNEVAERSWRLSEQPKVVRVKAKSAYTAEKLITAVKELKQRGETPIEAVYMGSPPAQFEEEHKRELLGSDESGSDDDDDKATDPAQQPDAAARPASPAQDPEAAPVSWAEERYFWLEVYDVPGIGAPGNFDLTQNDSDQLTAALKPLLPESANPELDVMSLVRLRHDSNAILGVRLRTKDLVQQTLDRAKDKAVNEKALKVRLAFRQPRQVRMAIRKREARTYAESMRLRPALVLAVDDCLERLVCRITGEPEPPLEEDEEEELKAKDDDEIMEVQEEEKQVEVIDIDLDSDEEAGPKEEPEEEEPASPGDPTEKALDAIAAMSEPDDGAPPAKKPPPPAGDDDDIVCLSD